MLLFILVYVLNGLTICVSSSIELIAMLTSPALSLLAFATDMRSTIVVALEKCGPFVPIDY